MGEWRTDPTFAMCGALADGAELSSFAGGPFDVRAVVAAIRPEAKDGFQLDEVPWRRFPQRDHVREAVHLLHTGNSPVRTGKGVVSGKCANDMRAAAVLAVPFLIRIAADTRHPHRVDGLAEVSSPARARHFGVASRDELRAAVADLTTDDRARAMDALPWMAAAGGSGETGLQRCVRKMLHPEQPDPAGYDDPWAPGH
ncbi:hypothetical protein ABT237_24795 [Streptomyces sp. NPDC001581]|uniref:hypothetical protein n=1 Tax=Streptomyces sp. NPDC001581 TaxID=3154386 RepID=UPI00332B179B